VNIRVAVVGLGWAARTIWLPRFDRAPGWTVAALVDPDPSARAAAAAGRSGARMLASPDELAPGDADLVVVAAPNHAHSAVACGLLRRGLPVFLEKPVCLTITEADDLAAAEHAGGGTLIAGSAARHRADIRTLQQVLPSLGPVRHVSVAWERARGVPGTGWFTRRDQSGGGALVDLGWHLLDTALPLLGTDEVEQVVGAVGDDFVRRAGAQAVWKDDDPRTDPGAGDVEDTVRAFLATRDGVSVSLHAAWASHAALDTTVVEVHGSYGVAALRCTFGFSPNRDGRSRLTVSRDGDATEIPLPDEPIGTEYDRQIAALPALLSDPGERGRAVAEARRTIDVVERIYASARWSHRAPATRSPSWAPA
jgi:oxidoreductase